MRHGLCCTHSCSRKLNTHSEDAMAAKRELIQPKEGDKRFVRRDEGGKFTDSQDDVGRSLTQDRKQQAKTAAKPGQGDKGDRKKK
jgi:hypothetical protein